MGFATANLKCFVFNSSRREMNCFQGIFKGWFFNGVPASLNSSGAAVL